MKKKILLALSLIAILTVLFAISVCAQTPVETWDISKTSNDSVTAYLYEDTQNTGMYTLTISGQGNMKNWGYNGAPWYSSYKEKITSVVIENGVTNIGNSAFYRCNSLTSVVIGDSVTTIGNSAFNSCESLTSVVIGDSVTTIGDSAFSWCYSLTSVVIPESVITIGEFAFSICPMLTNAVIPDGVKHIYMYAFASTGLTEVVIPDSVAYIGNYAFGGCDDLTSIIVDENNVVYKSVDGNLYSKNGKTLYQYACGKKDTSFMIPDGVSFINEFAISYCNNLKSVIIPDSVTGIYSWAFQGSSLTIYFEAEDPSSLNFSNEWNCSNCPVIYGCNCNRDTQECEDEIFTFKGYSFGFAGQISFGYDIDYEALALYEAKTGKTLEIGVVFAGYDNLGGKQPLDENGKAIEIQVGKVIKADLTNFKFPYYDFMLFDIGDSIKDVKLVISAYIYNGETVKYVQANGLSETVMGISYNEAKESIGK